MLKTKLVFLFLILVLVSSYGQTTLVRGALIDFNQHFAQARSDNEKTAAYFYRFGHFKQIPTATKRARLEAKGVEFLNYYANNTYLLAFAQAVSPELCQSIGMDGLVMIPVSSKLSQKVKERPIPHWAQAKGDLVKIIVTGYRNKNPRDFGNSIASLGLAPDFAGRHQPYVELTVPEEMIEILAQLHDVAFIDWVNPPAVLEDNNGRAMHRSNMLNTAYPGGRHYDGLGVNVLVRDDGSVGPHIDFQGRVDQANPIDFGGGSHGDMVSGIFVGAGNIEPTNQGMASGAKLFVRDYNDNFETYTMDLHLNENVKVTSSSYGDGCNAGYTALTRTIDKQIFDNQTLIHIFSAGNSGSSDCNYGVVGWGNITGGHKQGKNAIATGNLNVDESLNLSSSHGPAYDGRIKPDLCAHGAGQMSTDPDNIYNPGSGTSAASPGAAGVFTQLIDAYRTINGGADPKSGLIKACLLNTAIDLGNVGPDFKFGWGELNGYRAVKIIENGDYLLDTIEQGQSDSHIVNVANGMTQVRFMLYWMDPAAPAGASVALINDLDLKVVSPTGDTILPWVLDPTPTDLALNAPATHGVDHLNNMEQVVFQAPVAGDYQILVNGFAVPMGPQEYYVLSSAVDNPLFMAFPVGGEHFAPAEEIRIFWDAYDGLTNDFTVEVSYDNGSSWGALGVTSEYSLLWTIPNTPTSKGLVRVSRNGATTQSLSNFSIMARPANLSVDTVCAHSVYVSWDAVPDATSYDVFVLGEKYMDSVATTLTNSISFSVASPDTAFWYSVRAEGANGLVSERAYAQYYAGGLLECQVNFDLMVDEIIGIADDDIAQCESQKIPIQAIIRNIGVQTMTDFVVQYSKNNETPITAQYAGTLNPGQTVTWVANDTLQLLATGQYGISVEVINNMDEITANNTLAHSFFVEDLPTSSVTSIQEGFEGTSFPPLSWKLTGNDPYLWTKSANVVGLNGEFSSVVWVDNYLFNNIGEQAIIETAAMQMDVEKVKLSFDYAYANYSTTYSDTLEVTVYDPCDTSKGEAQLFFKGGNELRTIPDLATNKWQPQVAADWRHKEFIISDYANGYMKVKFINYNGWGNSLYLDNIQLQVLEGIRVASQGCVGDMLAFSTDYIADSLAYQWDFDNGGGLVTGAGPYDVIYTTPGTKNVQLILTSPSGQDTFYTTVLINQPPVSAFSTSLSDNVVTCTDLSTGGLTFMWTFGDGSTSTLQNPSHTYDLPGNYEMCLVATNECGSDTTCSIINVLTNIHELNFVFPGVVLAPNPASDYLSIINRGTQVYSIEYSIWDITGRLMSYAQTAEIQLGEQKSIDVSMLSSGVYVVKLVSKDQIAYAKILIE